MSYTLIYVAIAQHCPKESLDRYQLAANMGRRSKKIEVESGKAVILKLVLQPKGLDVLGDWEDLCGLVFG